MRDFCHKYIERWANVRRNIVRAGALAACVCLLALAIAPSLAFSDVYPTEDTPSPFLRSGLHDDWRSRTVLPDYAQQYYDWLVEGSNPDSETPYLIDSSYYSPSASFSDPVIGKTAVSSFFKVLDFSYLDAEEREFVTNETIAQTYAAWAAFRRDHPEVFWLNGQCWYGQTSDMQSQGLVSFRVFLKGPDADVRTARFGGALQFSDMPLCSGTLGSNRIRQGIKLRDEKVAEALDRFPEGATDAEKVALLNDFLCERNTYNKLTEAQVGGAGGFKYRTTAWESLRCLNALVGSKSEDGPNKIAWEGDLVADEDGNAQQVESAVDAPTSEGLAAAFKVLCDAAGIPCLIEDGALAVDQSPCKEIIRSLGFESSYMYHQWNIVQIDGLWYAVDVALNLAASEADPTAAPPYLLVGSDTVVDATRFNTSHIALNYGYNPYEAMLTNLVKTNPLFTNGPVITNQAYADAPYHFEPALFDAGDCYGATVEAAASTAARVFTLAGAEVEGGSWEWESDALSANDTEDFYKVLRYRAQNADGTERVAATAMVPFQIDRKRISVAPGTIASKTYDGTTLATFAPGKEPQLTCLPSESDSAKPVILPGDDVVLKAEAHFDDAEVGSGKDVTVTYRLMGADAGHYQLVTDHVTMWAAADILPVPEEPESPSTPEVPTTPTAPATPDTPSTNKPSGNAPSSSNNASASSGSTAPSTSQSAAKTSLSRATLSLSARSFTFNGKAKKPTVTVKLAGKKLRSGTDFHVTYSKGRTGVGSYRVTVAGCGAYTGSVSTTFKIVKPTVKKTSLTKVKGSKRALTATWKKASGNVTGYQVQCATDKKFKKSKKTQYVKGKTKRSAKITKLKAKKKYYVRVRTVYKVGGKTFYSNWSAVKTARVK